MTTYAETKGEEPFDWNAYLNKPRRTSGEILDAVRLSNYWITCACGNQCDVIPRNFDGIPLDTELRILGRRFTSAIEYRAVKRAKLILAKIEARSKFLIDEIKANEKTTN